MVKIHMRYLKVLEYFNKLTAEIQCQPKISSRVLLIIGLFTSSIYPKGFFFVKFSRLEYEKRNKKKEAKEAAAYEAFQKLKAENRNESTAVNIDQK